MEVNREPEEINALLDFAIENLRPGGRLAVISFHSLEDRPLSKDFANGSDPAAVHQTCLAVFVVDRLLGLSEA